MNAAVKNEIILASAGSGKTYRLTNRFIALMMLDVPPERIIALTFTRKAAGEFFDAILQKLAGAATDPNKATEIAVAIGDGSFTPAAALQLLRRFIDTMPRLALGTLDSFFADIVRAFPFEFGLSGGFEILDPHGQRTEKDRVYRQVFDESSTGAAEFLDSFKLATFGREDAGIIGNLERFIDGLHETFLAAPDAARWGNPGAIWPSGMPWHEMHEQALQNVVHMLEEGFNASGEREKVLLRWQRFFNWLLGHEAGSPVPDAEKQLFENLLGAVDQLEQGGGEIFVDGCKHKPDPAECDSLYLIAGHLIAGELEARLRRTRGLWMVLSGYEESYDKLVRRRGRLTFADLTLLLAQGGSADQVFATVGGRREQIEYRLDAAYDHWLLDEFQDTSALQWKAIENLVDEAAFDPEERRSLFQVGDLKQAIYAWRGGDASLFSDLRDRYRELGPHRFHEEPLDKSYRSSPAVIDGVNSIFGDRAAITELFPAMRDRWEFTHHTTTHTDRPGYTGWLAAEKIGSRKEADLLPARLDIVAELLGEIDPLRRGLSVAVLVARNRTGAAVTDHLRAHTDLAITNAADVGIASDNPLTVALRSVFRAAAHPGDTFARGHLLMTPLAPHLEEPAEHSATVLRSVWRGGFEATAREWIARLPDGLDAFSCERAEEFARAAARFDTTGERSVDGFLRFIEGYTTRDATSGGSVQVMTVHKSKGLGFDIVILPELGGDSLDVPRRDTGVNRNAEREIEWVLQMPNKNIAQADHTLRQFLEERAAEACYENLCLNYVALTRAKFANYLITDARSANSRSKNFVKLMGETLGAQSSEKSGLIYDAGEPDWYRRSHPIS